MDHQNWEQVVMSKKPGAESKGEKAISKALKEGKEVDAIKKTTATNKTAGPTNVAKILETEEYKVETVSFELKIAIQQARNKKGLKQAELAALINEKASVVGDYEAGRAIPSAAVINKLERALGAKLPRPKKKKAAKPGDDD